MSLSRRVRPQRTVDVSHRVRTPGDPRRRGRASGGREIQRNRSHLPIRNHDVDKDERDGDGGRVNGLERSVRRRWRCTRISTPPGLDRNLPMVRPTQPLVVPLWMHPAPTIETPRHGNAMHPKPSPQPFKRNFRESHRWLRLHLHLHLHLYDVRHDSTVSPSQPRAKEHERQCESTLLLSTGRSNGFLDGCPS